MDLKDTKGIETLGKIIAEKFGKLDGFVANAGLLGTLGPLETCGPRSFEETIQVNLTANAHLIRALGPSLHRAENPRAVFVTSESEKMALRVNLFDPGAVRTGMRAEAMPGEDPMTLPTPEDVAKELVKLVAPEETRTGARVVYREVAAN
nr:SDR family NAD(P)-dependent oxidoreductase [Hyphomonas sp. 34-62-18]